MQSIVALPANIDTLCKRLFTVMLLKKIASMHLFWDQVMEGQVRLSMTQRAFA
jgi:hypothetical protein